MILEHARVCDVWGAFSKNGNGLVSGNGFGNGLGLFITNRSYYEFSTLFHQSSLLDKRGGFGGKCASLNGVDK